ncbi:MAG: hypothetical protein HQ534_10680 [Armatimonadetes bacterium]|nr:hypothetical protein [Armatimonadota bacterium]
MKTIISIGLLIVFGGIATSLSVFLLNIVGLPGALLAGKPGQRSKGRFIFGSIISAIGQSYLYLSFIAFIVNWTLNAAAREDVIGFILWPFAFFVSLIPLWHTFIRASVEARELKFANPQVEALQITVFISILSFFVFAFIPSIVKIVWSWVPYV